MRHTNLQRQKQHFCTRYSRMTNKIQGRNIPVLDFSALWFQYTPLSWAVWYMAMTFSTGLLSCSWWVGAR